MTLSRIIRSYLVHVYQHGCWNFDVVIAKCLTVVLIASLGCRSGDVGRSLGYTGTEYLKYEDITLYLEAEAGAEPRFQDLRAEVTLHYTKNHKAERDAFVVKYLRPLDDTESCHVCPITLLIVHALRHGLVHGSTVEQLLQHNAARPDLRVEWIYPHRPVLTTYVREPFLHCNLDEPASAAQPRRSIKEMGLVAGMLSRCYAHALRLGAIRDYAHLPKEAVGDPLEIDLVRRFAGHKPRTMQTGVTDRYMGDAALDLYNARAEKGGIHHRREPKFASDPHDPSKRVQARITTEELQECLRKRFPGQVMADLTQGQRAGVHASIRRER